MQDEPRRDQPEGQLPRRLVEVEPVEAAEQEGRHVDRHRGVERRQLVEEHLARGLGQVACDRRVRGELLPVSGERRVERHRIAAAEGFRHRHVGLERSGHRLRRHGGVEQLVEALAERRHERGVLGAGPTLELADVTQRAEERRGVVSQRKGDDRRGDAGPSLTGQVRFGGRDDERRVEALQPVPVEDLAHDRLSLFRIVPVGCETRGDGPELLHIRE